MSPALFPLSWFSEVSASVTPRDSLGRYSNIEQTAGSIPNSAGISVKFYILLDAVGSDT